MALILSISTNTAPSEPTSLCQLFLWHAQALEIGTMRSIHDYTYLLNKCRITGTKTALHPPFLRVDDRFGLLWGDDTPWMELERNLLLASMDSHEYIIVNFPYFWSKSKRKIEGDLEKLVIGACRRIRALSADYGVPVIIRPIVGPDQNPHAFLFLNSKGHKFIDSLGLDICIDVGHVFLAARKLEIEYLDLIELLAPRCSVIHLHHVWLGGKRVFWTPVEKYGNVPILQTLRLLERSKRDIYAVLAHDYEKVIDKRQVEDGLNWLLNSTGPWKDRGIYPSYDGKYKGVR